MIYTVTFNPSIDYYVEIEDLQLGKTNRTKNTYKYPGGKGINVSRVLKRIGSNNEALGFIGGFTGRYIEEYLEKENISTDFIKIKENTRINIKIKNKQETEINAEGPNISNDNLKELIDRIGKLTCEDFLVLSGNVQSNLNRGTYAKIQEKCLKNNVKVIVDTTGEELTLTLKNKPFLIKPNNYELGDIFGVEINSKEDILKYGKKLMELGAQNVIVSMGNEGAMFLSEEGFYYSPAPKGKLKNSVGSGDALIGGFLDNYSKNSNLIEAFKYGVACGSATAFSQDLCTGEDADKLLEKVHIVKIG